MDETITAAAPERSGVVARWHLPTVFAAVFVAFCLPFATVSCDRAETSFTGMQLVTHTVPHGGTFEDEDSKRSEISDRVEGQSSVTATLILLVAAIGLTLGLRGRRGTGWCAGVGLILGLVLGMNTDDAYVTYHWGYWSILLLFVWACLVHIARGLVRRVARSSPYRGARP
jgi:hypothetical protein